MATSNVGILPNVFFTSLGVARIAVGASTLFTPQFGSSLFGVSLAAESSVLVQLFASRELLFGILTVRARNRFVEGSPKGKEALTEQAKRDLRNLLLVGLLVDAMDLGSALVGVYKGELTTKAAGLVGGGAFTAILLGFFGLRGL